MNLPSNSKLTSYKKIRKHPIYKAFEYQMNFSINTDDPGVFECSMTSEYQKIIDHASISEEELKNLYKNSIASSFRHSQNQ